MARTKAATAPGMGIVVVAAARSAGFPVTHDKGSVIASGTKYASMTDDARFCAFRESIGITMV
jgi:hypothetical protein